jgi:hypothetical protein
MATRLFPFRPPASARTILEPVSCAHQQSESDDRAGGRCERRLIIDSQPAPVIPAAHSYGGVVIQFVCSGGIHALGQM